MTFISAQKINEFFSLDKDYNLVLKDTKAKLEDPLSKGYAYACLFFYDETQKELDKLRALITKFKNEIITELGYDESEPSKMLMELSARVRQSLGDDDSLDAMIKEMLSEKNKHIALMVEASERDKLNKITGAIFSEIVESFYNMTFNDSREVGDKKSFQFSAEYINKLTDRQKKLLSPAIRMIALSNQIKLNFFEISPNFVVKYIPERIANSYARQEEQIKDNIKDLIKKHL